MPGLHHCRTLKQTQEGLKVVIISCICFAITVTVALVITIAVLPPQVSSETYTGTVSGSNRVFDVR